MAKINDKSANPFSFREASEHSDVCVWLADAFFSITDSERKEIGSSLSKFARVMLKETGNPRHNRDEINCNL